VMAMWRLRRASVFRAAWWLAPDGTVYIADTANNAIRVLTAGAAPKATGVTNAASFAARISPGALASVFGSGFGTVTAQGDLGFLSNALPTSINSISVKVNGTPAPMLYLSPGQINFQVPWKTAVGNGQRGGGDQRRPEQYGTGSGADGGSRTVHAIERRGDCAERRGFQP